MKTTRAVEDANAEGESDSGRTIGHDTPEIQSGGDVRDELNLQLKDLILDLQPLLFQTAQLEFVVTGQRGEPVDDVIEIAVFDLQFDDAAMDRLFIHIHG